MLMNEPGIGSIEGDFAKKKYSEWKLSHPQKELSEKGFPILADFSRQMFLLEYNTWYLNWIAGEIKKYDTRHEIHVNSHAMFQLCSIYDFPAWRKFLTIFGGSTHPAWHFGYFDREKYSVAMSANCEMIRSGAGEIPWMITELQGGNNIYSAYAPLCPTKEEIAQWLWIAIGTEARGSIFWTLNPTISISEAGEWGMIDYQYKPTDRLIAASEDAGALLKNGAVNG
jgi:beta-galactosidase